MFFDVKKKTKAASLSGQKCDRHLEKITNTCN